MPLSTSGSDLLDAARLLERAGVRAGQQVADLGCGVTGHIVIPTARMVGTEGRVYAVDVQKSALAATESRAKLEGITNIEYVWADIERVGASRIPPGALDAAFIVNTLFLTIKREEALREAARLVKSDGVIVVVEWKTDATAVGPAPSQRIGKDVVRQAATAAGLTERDSFEAGSYHYGLIFTK